MSSDQSTMTTMPTEWARVDAALDELLALPPTVWSAAIERIAQGDAALADELHSLLAAAIDADQEITGGNGLTGAARAAQPDDLPLDPARYRELDAKVARALAPSAAPDEGARRVERRAVARPSRVPSSGMDSPDSRPAAPAVSRAALSSPASFAASRRANRRPARGWGVLLAVLAGVLVAMAWRQLHG